MSLNESINASQVSAPRMRLMSQISEIRRDESQYDDFQFVPKKIISHEMAVGSDRTSCNDAFTDVKNLVMRDEIGVMTKNVETHNANTATCTEFAVASSQHETETRDTGCDG